MHARFPGGFFLYFQFIMPSQIGMSTCIGVYGCGFPISSDVVLNTMDYMYLIKRAANSAS